ncbi:jg3513 [Pararge aegeria aegeria]|uniref:Jg3513 protein n=1 Tax=Pararge aegeria aegeria TaxID=348720 RepID=A0A8S4QQW8_9NEOP|nr:jg3513 [Pararge aegeria aegeria]
MLEFMPSYLPNVDALTNDANFCTPSRSGKLHIWGTCSVLRHERYVLLQLIMMAKVAGRRGFGRRKSPGFLTSESGLEPRVQQNYFLAKNRQGLRN